MTPPTNQQNPSPNWQELPAHFDNSPSLEAAAVTYAAYGIPVLPLQPRDKRPATAHGHKDASADLATVRAMWAEEPSRNVGVPTGGRSGVVVLDVDGEVGEQSLRALQQRFEPLLPTLEAGTGRGRHLYFTWEGAEGIRNSAGKLGAGLDVRGEGGYVAAPPSVHASGHVYAWRNPLPPARMPQWLVAQLTPPQPPSQGSRSTGTAPAVAYGHRALADECAKVAGAPKGTRRNTLNTAALKLGQLVAAGALNEREVQVRLTHAAAACGLASVRAKRTIHDGLADGSKSPRVLPERPVRDGQPPDPPVDQPEEWEAPLPIAKYEVPEFPVGQLPLWMSNWVVEQAEATQTPLDLAGVLALATASGAIAGHFVVQASDDWTEPLNLYALCVLEPGNRKTAVFRAATASMRKYEALEAERLAPKIRRARSEADLARQQLESLKKRASGGSVEDEAEIHDLVDRLAELDTAIPPEPRLVVEDITPEALGKLLADHGRLVVLSDEGGGLFSMLAGRYSRKPNFDLFLKAHDGGGCRVDRVGRPSLHIPSALLTVGLTVQPDVIQRLVDEPGFRGQGLLARFLFAVPESPVGRRNVNPTPMSPETRELYGEAITAMLSHEGEPRVLTLSAEARARLRRFSAELEPQLAPGANLGPISDWGGKLAGAVVRIAGVLHVGHHVTDVSGVIGEKTMEAACEFGTYFVGHAKAAFALMGADPVLRVAQEAAAWLKYWPEPSISRRDLYREKHRRIRNAAAADPVLEVLIEHGYLRPLPQDGRKSPRFLINPKIR